MPVETLLKRGLIGAGALAVALPVMDMGLDIMKERFKTIRKPSWEAMGQARMYGQHIGDVRYARGQEQLLKGMFDLPYDIFAERAQSLGGGLMDTPGNLYKKYQREGKFDELVNDPNVQAIGVDNARRIYREVAELAPDVIRKAPHAALPAIQNALVTQSEALDPMYVKNLVDAQFRLQN
jgi:hypothetical protein